MGICQMSDLKYVYSSNDEISMSLEEAIQYNEQVFLRYYKCYALTRKEVFFSEMEQRAEFLDAARTRPKDFEFY